MAIKSALQTEIIGFTDGGNNTALEFRTFASDLLNSVYAAPINETSAAPSILTPTSNPNYPYELRLTKQGGQVTIQGRIGNHVGSLASSPLTLAIFNAGEYLPKDDFIYRGIMRSSALSAEVRIYVLLQNGEIIIRVGGGFTGQTVSAIEWYDIEVPIIYNTAE